MVFRTWVCVVALVSWSGLGAACAESTAGGEVETVTGALTTAAVGAIQLCGTKKGVDCADGTYCRHHDGVCGDSSIGWCAPVSEMCTMQYAPVCGCDGQTYGNECVMMGAAVSMSHEGACADGCASDADCGQGEACDFAGCGDDIPGQCVKVPMYCSRLFDPVCSCDGDTFPNDCQRVKGGAAFAHAGPCASPCGGIAGFQCEDGETCYYQEGTCDYVDNMGMCQTPPNICPKNTDPVCGCDGHSYRNECMMKHAGVSMDHPGMCCLEILCFVGEAIDTDGDGCGDVCPSGDLCEGPNPAGCKNTGCEDGETCAFDQGCAPSICFCDGKTGLWACTKDCGGGVCVPDEPICCDPEGEPGTNGNPACFEGASCCADGSWQCNDGMAGSVCEAPGDVCEVVDLCEGWTAPGCVQSGCDDGFVCDTTVDCVPSVCSCDPETGMAMCTMDCAGGTCVPDDSNAICEEPNPEACKVGDCDDGYTCDLSFGCGPSTCSCWADADGVGHWNCTKDCKPGVCVPDDLGAGCCIDDVHCDVGELCVNGGPNSVGVCKQLPPPAFPATSCWSDQGCPEGETCDGGTVCPCNAQCFAPDSWGLCTEAADPQ